MATNHRINIGLCALFALSGCSASDSNGSGGSGSDDYYYSEGTGGTPGSSSYDGSAGATGTADPIGTGEEPIASGQLTAGDWDDNLNFGHYAAFIDGSGSVAGDYPLLPIDRIPIEVVDGDGVPLRDTSVSVRDADGVELIALVTGSNGRTAFYPSHDGSLESYQVVAVHGTTNASLTLAGDAETWLITVDGTTATAATAMDLALVIDTTGSMGDEIAYLQAEVRAVLQALDASHPDLDLRLGLVAYRDRGDAYETRSYEFTRELETFLADLAALEANGGGDYPESVAEGLEVAMGLDWRTSDTVRVAFLVGDAPPQVDRQVTTADAAQTARARGIHLYPIASSGVDTFTELVFRQVAQFSHGRYLFLTDDSGIGLEHAEPHIPCYLVQLLEDLMVRVLENELQGHWSLPEPADILRSSGSPEGGICLVDGEEYYIQ